MVTTIGIDKGKGSVLATIMNNPTPLLQRLPVYARLTGIIVMEILYKGSMDRRVSQYSESHLFTVRGRTLYIFKGNNITFRLDSLFHLLLLRYGNLIRLYYQGFTKYLQRGWDHVHSNHR